MQKTAVVALAEAEGEIVHYAAATGKHTDSILDRRVLVCPTEGDRRVRQDQVKALIYSSCTSVL